MELADRARRDDELHTASARGPSVLTDLGPRLDDLLDATDAPITFRRPWLDAWARSFTGFEPWAITVSHGERIDGAALLARRRRLGHTEIVPMGYGPSDAIRLPARDEQAVEALATACIEGLVGLRGPWRLVLGQIPDGDPVAARIANAWPHAELGPGDGSPVLTIAPGATIDDVASTGYRKNLRRGWRQLEGSGHVILSFVSEPGAVADVLPQLDVVRKQRDAALPRGTELDQPEFGAFVRRALTDHARRSEVEIAVLRIDDRCAGYAICLADGSAYRLWQTSFDPAWAEASPGRLLLAATVERALAREGCREYDFMRGVYDWKTALASGVVPAGRLLALSSGRLRSLEAGARGLRGRLRRGDDR